jgi:hypothetical protein
MNAFEERVRHAQMSMENSVMPKTNKNTTTKLKTMRKSESGKIWQLYWQKNRF